MDNFPPVASALCYRDANAAFLWLEKAFGLEPAMVITDADGKIMHSEMTFEGGGRIMVGTEWTEEHKSPASIGGKNTQTVHLHMAGDINAHCERARAAGAQIIQAPEDQFYGDRTYRAKDLEGHIWTFGQTVKVMDWAEWDKAMPGIKTSTRLEP